MDLDPMADDLEPVTPITAAAVAKAKGKAKAKPQPCPHFVSMVFRTPYHRVMWYKQHQTIAVRSKQGT
eukprot:2446336-Amphidinium_carterae.1